MNVAKQYQIAGEGSNAIAASIEHAIGRGRLAPSARLPTVRALARDLSVSLGTVAAAYRRLQTRGMIVSDGRRGTLVRPAPPLARRANALEIPAGIVDLADGNPDPLLLPALGPALDAVPRKHVLYGGIAYDPRLLELAARSFKADGVACSAVAVVHGALDGIERALAAQLRTGDRVAVEDPVYPAHLDLLGALGLIPEPVEVDAAGMTPEGLARAMRRGARAMIHSPRGQNPTGASLDARRQRALRETIERHPDVFVIEDDHAWFLAGTPYRTLAADRERWFVVRSLSKAFGPDLRVGVASGDPMTIARLQGRQQIGIGWVSHISQSIAVALWNDRRIMAKIERSRETYAARRQGFVDALEREGITVRAPSGFNCWVPVRDEAATSTALRDAGFAVATGERFRIRTPPAIRVTIARLPTREAAVVAQTIASARRPGSLSRTA